MLNYKSKAKGSLKRFKQHKQIDTSQFSFIVMYRVTVIKLNNYCFTKKTSALKTK